MFIFVQGFVKIIPKILVICRKSQKNTLKSKNKPSILYLNWENKYI